MRPRQITLMRGLSGSGKSTAARSTVEESGFTSAIVSMDSIRNMLGLPYTRENEDLALRIQDQAIMSVLLDGKDVIIDNTHLHLRWPRRYVKLVRSQSLNVQWVLHDLLEVPFATCIENDAQRTPETGYVGEDVIDNQARTVARSIRELGHVWTIDDMLGRK